MNNIKTLFRGYQEVKRANKRALPMGLLYALFSSLAPFVNIVMFAKIVDELIGDRDFQTLVTMAAITVLINFILHLLSKGFQHLYNRERVIAIRNQDMIINEKIISMDYEYIENPEIHTLRAKITDSSRTNYGGLGGVIIFTVNAFKGFVKIVASLVVSYGLLKSFFVSASASAGEAVVDSSFAFINGVWFSVGFVALIVITIILNIVLNAKSGKKIYDFMNQFMDLNRLFVFYYFLANEYQSGKAIRLYHQQPIVDKQVNNYLNRTYKTFTSLSRLHVKYIGTSVVLTAVLDSAVFIFVALKAVAGAISIGGIYEYTGAIRKLIEGINDVISSGGFLFNNNRYLQYYLDFIDIDGGKYQGTLPVEKRDDDEYEIEFRNVSFKYPGTEEYALKNVSVKLNIGERLAIVGMNGSGKTTFIKLLSRLYDPDEGEILLNGIDIKKYDYDEYIKLFSIVFQDFSLFSFEMGQNIASSVDYDEHKVELIAAEAGLEERLKKMEKGVHTPLYQDFDDDGVEISGGEAQKIALARALHRDAPVIILDEPTAALDPISEYEIYTKFDELVGSKTAFYISHRLSSCRFCDEVAVFHEGELIQKGAHDELVADKSGKYHELWNAQAQYYKE